MSNDEGSWKKPYSVETYILVSKQFIKNKGLIKSLNQIKKKNTNTCLPHSLDIQYMSPTLLRYTIHVSHTP